MKAALMWGGLLPCLMLVGLLSASQLVPVAGSRHVEVAMDADATLLDADDAPLRPALHDNANSIEDTTASHESMRFPDPLAGELEAQRVNPDDQSSDEIYALRAEIDALDDMIRLQEKKLQVLQELRNTILVADEGAPYGSTERFDGLRSRDAIERRLDAVEATDAEDSYARGFDAYFVERAALHAAKSVAAVKMLQLPLTQAVTLTLVAYTSGRLEFYVSPLVKVLEMALPGEHLGVESIALNMHGQQPCMVVKCGSKTLSTYALHLSERTREDSTAANAPELPHQLSFTTPTYELRIEQIGTAELEARVIDFTLVEGTGRIVASSEDGQLSVFSINGSRIDSTDTGTKRTRAVASLQRRVAFSDASNVVITSIGGGPTRTVIKCHGSSDAVTSLAFDPQRNDLIYAGTEAGDVLVFRFMWGAALSDQPGCQLMARAAATARKRGKQLAQVTVKAVKGYLLAAGPSELAVFNLSSASAAVPPSLQAVTSLKSILVVDDATSVLFDVAQGAFESNLVLVTTDRAGRSSTIKLFHSFLSSPAEQRDFPWVVVMYVAVAIVAVLVMQLLSRRDSERRQSPWDAQCFSQKLPLGEYGEQSARSSFVPDRGQNASFSSRIAQNKGRQSGYAVGEAFKEANYGDTFEEDESRATYRSLRDEVRQHLAASGRKPRG